jgi:hypothetical protein
LPAIQKVYDALMNEHDIAFILLTAPKDFDSSRTYLKSLNYTLPFYQTPLPGGKPMVNTNLPRTLVLDRNGIVVLSKTGEEPWNFWTERFRDFARASLPEPQRNYRFSADGIQIQARIVEKKPTPNLLVELIPLKGVKLVATKGVELHPVGKNSVKWIGPMPAMMQQEDINYFKENPKFTLSFQPPANQDIIDLEIEYAYCQPDSEQCIPAKAHFQIPSQEGRREITNFLRTNYGIVYEPSFFQKLAWDCPDNRMIKPAGNSSRNWVCRRKDSQFSRLIVWRRDDKAITVVEKDNFDAMTGGKDKERGEIQCRDTPHEISSGKIAGIIRDCVLPLPEGNVYVSFYHFNDQNLGFTFLVRNADAEGSTPKVREDLREWLSELKFIDSLE